MIRNLRAWRLRRGPVFVVVSHVRSSTTFGANSGRGQIIDCGLTTLFALDCKRRHRWTRLLIFGVPASLPPRLSVFRGLAPVQSANAPVRRSGAAEEALRLGCSPQAVLRNYESFYRNSLAASAPQPYPALARTPLPPACLESLVH